MMPEIVELEIVDLGPGASSTKSAADGGVVGEREKLAVDTYRKTAQGRERDIVEIDGARFAILGGHQLRAMADPVHVFAFQVKDP